jgi:ankyrin repeat protein
MNGEMHSMIKWYTAMMDETEESLQEFEQDIKKQIALEKHRDYGNESKLPLHVAIECGAHPRIIKLLLEAEPTHAQVVASGKSAADHTVASWKMLWKPVMMAIAEGPKKHMLEVVELCLKALPRFDVNSWHDMCILSGGPEVVALLLKYVPDAACQITDLAKSTCLHVALRGVGLMKYDGTINYSPIDLKSVQLLVEANPAALWHANDEEEYPLHVAAKYCSAEIVDYLLSVGPTEAVKAWDGEGMMTPLEIAVKYNDDDHRRTAVIARYDPVGMAGLNKDIQEQILADWKEMAFERRKMALLARLRFWRQWAADCA